MIFLDDFVMQRMREHLVSALETLPNDWFVLVAQGSMNYNLMDSNSDVDTKLLALPTLSELVFNKKSVNKVHILKNDEHCDIKDVRDYLKILRKQNVNFMEILFSDYYLVNERYEDIWLTLRQHAEEIARSNEYRFLKCCKGMILEKAHALNHPYPSKLDLLEEYGWDGKQLSHAQRIYDFAINFLEKKWSYSECLHATDSYRDLLMELKRNQRPAEYKDARWWMDNLVESITDFEIRYNADKKDELDPNIDKLLDDCLSELITRCIKNELGN